MAGEWQFTGGLTRPISTHEIPIEPLTPRYMFPDEPVEESFDWHRIHGDIVEFRGLDPGATELHVFVFRSLQKPGLTAETKLELAERDVAALASIRAADGEGADQRFFRYFAGEVKQRHSLSFCVWDDILAARRGMRTPAHHAAAALMERAYETNSVRWYDLSRAKDLGVASLRMIQPAV